MLLRHRCRGPHLFVKTEQILKLRLRETALGRRDVAERVRHEHLAVLVLNALKQLHDDVMDVELQCCRLDVVVRAPPVGRYNVPLRVSANDVALRLCILQEVINDSHTMQPRHVTPRTCRSRQKRA